MYFRVMLGVLSMLMYAGIVHAAPFAYIANNADDTVSVIDTSTYAVSAIQVGNGPYGVAVNPIGGRVYVSNQQGKTISVIDTLDNSVTSIPASGTLSYMPSGLAVNSAGTRLFVADGDGGSLSVFNVSNGTKLGEVLLGANQPDGVAVGPKDGSNNYKIYVTCFGSNVLKVISANDSTALASWGIATVTVGNGPKGVAVNADGSRVYVANMDSQSVTVLDGSNGLVATVSTNIGLMPAGISVNPAGTRVFVANSGESTISVIDASSNTATKKSLTNSNLQPFGISVSPDGNKVITSNHYGNKATVFNADATAILTDPVTGNSSISLGNLAGPVRYRVTTSAYTPSWYGGDGGSIIPPVGQVTMAPNGVVMVASGQTPTFSIVPQAYFAIGGVSVNGGAPQVVSSVTLPSVANDTQTIDATFNRTHFKVTLTKIGSESASATIISDDAAKQIDCGPSCTTDEALYPVDNSGTDINFYFSGTAGTNTTLVSWEGACSSYTTGQVCAIKMNEADARLKASPDGTFNIIARMTTPFVPAGGPVRIGTTPYQTIQAAYAAALTGSDIQVVTGSYTLVDVNRDVAVNLLGGYTDQTFADLGGAITINNTARNLIIAKGSVTVKSGSVIVY